MGYSFTIGNAVPVFNKDYGELYAAWAVERATSDDAPVFPNDEMTGNSNWRHPSYSGWSEFCRESGLYDYFYDEDGNLLSGHPGCVMIGEDDLKVVRHFLEQWKKHATLPPGFDGWPVFNKDTNKWESPDEGKYDDILARLIWLEYWMNWAIQNCETPAIQNT